MPYSTSTDHSFDAPHGHYFSFLEDQFNIANNLGHDLEAPWQALELHGDLSSVVTPFPSMNYLE
jgi:hypothetical protein